MVAPLIFTLSTVKVVSVPKLVTLPCAAVAKVPVNVPVNNVFPEILLVASVKTHLLANNIVELSAADTEFGRSPIISLSNC